MLTEASTDLLVATIILAIPFVPRLARQDRRFLILSIMAFAIGFASCSCFHHELSRLPFQVITVPSCYVSGKTLFLVQYLIPVFTFLTSMMSSDYTRACLFYASIRIIILLVMEAVDSFLAEKLLIRLITIIVFQYVSQLPEVVFTLICFFKKVKVRDEDVTSNGNIGNCDLSVGPPSWLSTNGSGILDWATAGHPTNGTNFCIQGSRADKVVHVAYHIDLGNVSALEPIDSSSDFRRDNQNACVNNNTRVVYCFPLCFNETLQNMVIESALKSNQPSVVANDIQQTTQLDWAITVIQVDYNDPAAHLNASVFLEPDSWCSVYVGIKPPLGFDYLYEIQLGKVLSDSV